MNVFAKLLLGGILLLSVRVAQAQDAHGTLRVVKGDVQIKSGKSGQTTKARIGQQVDPKDIVITGVDSRAKIVMVDNNEINVSPESQIEIQHYEFDPNAGKKEVLLNVIYGKVRAKVEQKYDGKTSKFEVKTPSAVAGVRGTDFLTTYNKSDSSSTVVTFRGAVQFGTPGPNGTINNPVSVTPGKTAQSVAGGAPTPPTNMSKGDLAKADNDSNADGKHIDSGKSDRTPAGDKKGNGASNSNSNGNGASAGNASGSGAAAAGSGNSASASGSTDPNAGSTSPTRQPSSTGSGPSTLIASDMPGNAPPTPPPVNPTALPPIIYGPVVPQAPPTCSICNQLIQNGGNAKANIHITH